MILSTVSSPFPTTLFLIYEYSREEYQLSSSSNIVSNFFGSRIFCLVQSANVEIYVELVPNPRGESRFQAKLGRAVLKLCRIDSNKAGANVIDFFFGNLDPRMELKGYKIPYKNKRLCLYFSGTCGLSMTSSSPRSKPTMTYVSHFHVLCAR